MNVSPQASEVLRNRLALDENGNEVLLGLTAPESAYYVKYAYRRLAGYEAPPAERDLFVKLHERHELARDWTRRYLRAKAGDCLGAD